ncbi:methylated-DNA--[protein]-cysteine S-methyltransferase [Phytoactinopolyspora alkaliphila]|uniref:Methylated-DNA--protein-cysteine methyltransferase n=1 Tax=Phytoactinopolyspora alkaliphila TaxID=1783498 RepID=A0A6N9YJY1_9ACTN|nr:methylated-DNA--[protein]-cysteine S-methyltransferase [Phytoactinopolyspora alkaliphila]NED95303.1 methylated-DNA--[protein]-cysteine S-methyltransferase [Phytoactinopolyspora alkaliphila]
MTVYWTDFASPLGRLRVSADDVGLTSLYMEAQRHGPTSPHPSWIRDDDRFIDVRRQLDLYFSGRLQVFDAPLNAAGTPFQREVWAALATIPYGEVRSYQQIAEHIGRPGASRAVGLANGRNPISIIVPCHRVIGASGALTGYGGGLERKRMLLDLEGGLASEPELPIPAVAP